MNSEQRAIIALAEKEGVSPIDKDARLIVHGMVNATRDQMRKHQVGYDKMVQAQQDCVLAELTEAYEELAITIARALASASTPFVIATCKKFEVSNGNFTATIKSDQAHYNDLISKVQDKGEVVIALYERQFRDGMDDIQSDKDQRSLGLDEATEQKPKKKAEAKPKAGAKVIEITDGMLTQAREFVTGQQNATFAGLQNFLKIDITKAGVILQKLEVEGIVQYVGDEKTGQYELVRNKPSGETAAAESGTDSKNGVAESLSDEIYEAMKQKVIKTQQVSAGALSVSFDCTLEVADDAIDRMELEGVISEEDDLGGRSILILPE